MLEFSMPEGGGIFFDNSPGFQTLQVETSTALNIFKKNTVINPALSANALGIYTFVPVGRDGEAHFGSFSTAKFTLRRRSAKGCVWNPKQCGINFTKQTISTCPIEHQSEVCADVLWDSCWEKLLAVGNGVKDLESTAESARFLAMALDSLNEGIGNDFWLLVTFGGHPYIEKANELGWWRQCGIDKKEWECFYEQQMACGGHLTMIDELKVVHKKENFSIEIKDSDVSGSKYVGDAMALFDELKENMTPDMALWHKTMNSNGQDPIVGASNRDGKFIIAVTQGIFDRYKKQLRQQYKNIPEGFYLTLYGESYGCGECGNTRLRGVLEYDGCIVVCMPEWTLFDKMTCVTSHRAMLLTPGVLGIAYDVSPSEQRTGMGLEVTKWDRAPYRGKTFMEMCFRVGASILDTEYMVSACKFIEPKMEAA